jgi:predicted TIM-barrel fold metal-dependent hydrolase
MVLDVHHHIGGKDGQGEVNSGDDAKAGGELFDPADPQVDIELRAEIMDRNGIDEAVIFPSLGYDESAGAEATRILNDRLMEIYEDWDRFACPVGTVEPRHDQAAMDELERLADEGFAGVMFHNGFQGLPINSPPTLNLLELADELGLVSFVHCYSPVMQMTERLGQMRAVGERVDNDVIILNSLNAWMNWEQVIDLGREYENFYFETTMLSSIGRPVEEVVNRLGADRVVFGSDLYTLPEPAIYHKTPDLFMIRNAQISEEERQLILEDNARRILDL